MLMNTEVFLKPDAVNQEGGSCQNTLLQHPWSTSYKETRPAKSFHNAQSSLLSKSQQYLQLFFLYSFYSKEVKILFFKKKAFQLQAYPRNQKSKFYETKHWNTNVQKSDTNRFMLKQRVSKYITFHLNAGRVILVGCLIENGICGLLY